MKYAQTERVPLTVMQDVLDLIWNPNIMSNKTLQNTHKKNESRRTEELGYSRWKYLEMTASYIALWKLTELNWIMMIMAEGGEHRGLISRDKTHEEETRGRNTGRNTLATLCVCVCSELDIMFQLQLSQFYGLSQTSNSELLMVNYVEGKPLPVTLFLIFMGLSL